MLDQIHELDTVALTVDLPAHGLLRGQVGTVVLELGRDAVEVEFVDEQGQTYALLTLLRSQLLRLHYHRTEAARHAAQELGTRFPPVLVSQTNA